MLLSNRVKIFLTLLFLTNLGSGCGYTESGSGGNNATPPAVENHLPFSTREPEVFTADIVITTGGITRRIKVARSGHKWRYDYDAGEKKQLSVIRGDDHISMLPDRRVYFQQDRAGSTVAETPDDLATTSLLHNRSAAEFREVGTENGLTRFEALPENAGQTRSVIFVDRSIGLPVRQEFYSLEVNDEILQYTMELQNFQAEADDSVFLPPENFRKVSLSEFQRLLKNN